MVIILDKNAKWNTLEMNKWKSRIVLRNVDDSDIGKIWSNSEYHKGASWDRTKKQSKNTTSWYTGTRCGKGIDGLTPI